jgi:transcriptional regulator with XRE-family HTH domain
MKVVRRIAGNVRRLREAQGLTQEQLAHRAGMHRTYVSQIERAVKNVTVVKLDQVAKGLGVPLTELVA